MQVDLTIMATAFLLGAIVCYLLWRDKRG